MKVELDWLKKKLVLPVEDKRRMIEPMHPKISISRQCELIGLNISLVLPACGGISGRFPWDEAHRRAIHKNSVLWSTENDSMSAGPGNRYQSQEGHEADAEMGIQAVYPKPNLSKADSEHKIYPYLLRGLSINRSEQVWSSDITYIRMSKGFVYLVAIMDRYSR